MWNQPIDIIELILKGMIIGIIASAPMGPVGVLTVQRTLNKGRWYGFFTGLGAAVSDLIYAAISLVGMSVVMDFVENPHNVFWFRLIGSCLLALFGIYTFVSDPTRGMHVSGRQRGTLLHNGLTGFIVTFSNPLIIFLFMAMMARFDFVVPEHYWEQAIGYLAILGGALLWWFCLTGVVDKVRARFKMETVSFLNRIIGVVVTLAGIIGIGWAFVGL